MAELRRTEAKAYFGKPAATTLYTMTSYLPGSSDVCGDAANERTFLHWMNMSVTIGSISAALLGAYCSPVLHGFCYSKSSASYLTQNVQGSLAMHTNTGAQTLLHAPSSSGCWASS